MAKLIVTVTSKDMIRPSSQTPDHLKTLQLSFRDQISPPVHIPFIFFYQTHTGNSETTTTLLKKSLSETLVQFYPFAGRVQDLWIDCNDEGVPFYEANVQAPLVQVMGNPNNPEQLLSLFPFPLFNTTNAGAGVQVNYFSCGGVAVAVGISHKVADGNTMSVFYNAWGNKARGDDDGSQINFVGASLFPQMNLDGIYAPDDDICKEKTVSKRLIFNKAKIDMLKRQAVGRIPGKKPPTKVEVVTAFLWKQYIKAARAKQPPLKIFAVAQVANLRTVKSSAIPKNSHGNIYSCTLASAPVDTETEYPELVDKLREAVQEIRKTSYYSEKMQTGDYVLENKKIYENIYREGGDYCFISDASKFPFYEVNFGWGTPIWVSMSAVPFKNFTFLMGTKCGEGIEAWLYVLEEYATVFEQDDEFRSLAPPSILAKL